MLKEATKRAVKNKFNFFPLNGNLEKLSFIRDNYFQLVNCYGVMEHLPNPIAVLKELERVAAPGGLIIFSVPRKGSLAWLSYAFFCPSLEIDTQRHSLIQSQNMKMTLYRFFRNDEVNKMIQSLTHMELMLRIPVAHGGMVGKIPSHPLKVLGDRGQYTVLDLWNLICKHLCLVPAGEYIAMRKKMS